MDYTTIWETSRQKELILVKNIFEKNNVRYKIFDDPEKADLPVRTKVQVHQNDVKRAEGLLLENGLLKDPAPGQKRVSMSKFWLWFVVALICLVIAAFLINMLMQA